mgnify:CR=1 FL=1
MQPLSHDYLDPPNNNYFIIHGNYYNSHAIPDWHCTRVFHHKYGLAHYQFYSSYHYYKYFEHQNPFVIFIILDIFSIYFTSKVINYLLIPNMKSTLGINLSFNIFNDYFIILNCFLLNRWLSFSWLLIHFGPYQ